MYYNITRMHHKRKFQELSIFVAICTWYLQVNCIPQSGCFFSAEQILFHQKLTT